MHLFGLYRIRKLSLPFGFIVSAFIVLSNFISNIVELQKFLELNFEFQLQSLKIFSAQVENIPNNF